jgi:cobalamin biosynthesis Mg chelatase CobN
MLSVRFAAILLLVSSALATPLNIKRQPWNKDLVNLYARTNNSSQSNSTSVDSSNNNSTSADSSSNSNSTSVSSSSNNNSTSANNSSSNSSSSSSSNNNQNGSNNNNQGSGVSLNGYASGFDNFRGSGNFDGSQNSQTVVIQEKQVVCHTEQVEIIQQKLVILQEMAKKIITEQICEVETQTIVIEQFSSSLSSFQNDIGRKSSKQVGYDQQVAGLLSNITNSDGSLSTSNLGFNGTSVGSQTVVPQGSNWDNSTGPARVSQAQAAAKAAANETSS